MRLLLLGCVLALACAPESQRHGSSREALSAPRLVDLNTTPGQNTSSDPGSFTRFGDAGVAFFASRRGVGRELFLTDGTEAGTRLVRDVNPNGGSPLSTPSLAAFGGVLAFGATDGTREDLWLSDGTSAGTLPVTLDGGWRALPGQLADALYFVSGARSSSNASLFRVEIGTTTPTPLAAFPNCVTVPHLVAGTTRVAFACEGTLGGPGITLRVSDGTPSGTQEIEQGLGTLGVVAWNGDTLWYATSTTLRRVDPGSTTPVTVTTLTGRARRIVFIGSVTWLLTESSLLRLEGTDVGAVPLTVCDSAELVRSPVLDEALLLPCFNATSLLRVRTDAGTEPLVSGLVTPRQLLRLDTRAAFRTGNALCTTDGTDAGLACGPYEFDFDAFQAAEWDGRIFFKARYTMNNLSNPELYSAPIATPDAGFVVVDVNPAASPSNPRALIAWRGGVALMASPTGIGYRMRLIDDAGVQVYDAGNGGSQYALLGEHLYTITDSNPDALLRTRGRPSDVEYFSAPTIGDFAATSTHVLAFARRGTTQEWELWSFSSAADAGPEVLGSFTQVGLAGPCCFSAEGANAAFTTRAPDGGMRLWRTDGTLAGTRALTGSFSNGPTLTGVPTMIRGETAWLTNFGGRLMGSLPDGGVQEVFASGSIRRTRSGEEYVVSSTPPLGLFAFDGGGFEAVVPGVSGVPALEVHGRWQGRLLYTQGGRLFAGEADGGRVTLAAELDTSLTSSDTRLTTAGGLLFFAAGTADSGTELFMLRSPAATPELVADLQPGPAGSDPNDLTFDGQRLSFAADDGSPTGRELWVIDLDAAELDAGVPPTGGGNGSTGGGGGTTATGGGSAQTGGGEGTGGGTTATGGGSAQTGGGDGSTGGGSASTGGGDGTGGGGDGAMPGGCGCSSLSAPWALLALIAWKRRRETA